MTATDFPALGDIRFDQPLYTVSEAARYLDISKTTFNSWIRGYTRPRGERPPTIADPVITAFTPEPTAPRGPTVPFVGLVEGMVLAAIRRSGVPLQRIRPALDELQREFGIGHALASRRLYTDGAEVLFDIAERVDGDVADAQSVRSLIVVRNRQYVFTDIVREYLQRIDYDADGFAGQLHLPLYNRGEVVVDATRSFGKPIFARGGARVADVLERFWTGESLEELTDEFGVPADDLEDAVRVASRLAA